MSPLFSLFYLLGATTCTPTVQTLIAGGIADHDGTTGFAGRCIGLVVEAACELGRRIRDGSIKQCWLLEDLCNGRRSLDGCLYTPEPLFKLCIAYIDISIKVDPNRCTLVTAQEFEGHPTEDVVNDRFCHTDVWMLREPRWFKTHVHKLVNQHFQWHPVLESDRDGRGK